MLWGCHLGDNCENILETWKRCVLTSLSLSAEEVAACSPPSWPRILLGLWVDKEGLTMCQRDNPHLIVLMGQTLCLHSIFSHRSLTFKALDFPAIMSVNLHNILKVLTDKIKTQLSCVVPLDFWREMLLVDRI